LEGGGWKKEWGKRKNQHEKGRKKGGKREEEGNERKSCLASKPIEKKNVGVRLFRGLDHPFSPFFLRSWSYIFFHALFSYKKPKIYKRKPQQKKELSFFKKKKERKKTGYS
jgi:hypothetical protein